MSKKQKIEKMVKIALLIPLAPDCKRAQLEAEYQKLYTQTHPKG